MRQRGFGMAELFLVAVIVVAASVVGYQIYKGRSNSEPVVETPAPIAVPEPPKLEQPADLDTSLQSMEELDFDEVLEQADQLTVDSSS